MFLEPMMASAANEKKRATLSHITGYWLEPKHDGMRAIVAKDDGVVRIYSRAGLSYEDHLPKLVEQFMQLPEGTTLDGELMVVKKTASVRGHLIKVADFNATMRILGSLPEKAMKRQEDLTVEFCAFDVPRLREKSLEDVVYTERIKALDDLIDDQNMPSVFKNPTLSEWDYRFIDELMEQGIEGAILKNVNSLYLSGKRRSNNWYKVKAELTADVVVMGFTEAKEGKTGKWLGKVGAIIFGAYNADNELVEIGQCSGMSDAERDRWTAIRDSQDLTVRVIEVKYNDLVGSGEFGTPRHPQFKTERIDKRPLDCLLDQFKM